MLLKRINECRNSIADKVIEINSIRERNRQKDGVAMSTPYKHVLSLLNELESSLDIADNEFSEKYLDQCEQVLTKIDFENCEGFANETFKAIMNLLKQAEKEYDFNVIDPVDEDRDQMELRHKLLSFEKSKHEMNPILAHDENKLSDEDKIQFEQIEDMRDLDEIKRVEDKLVRLLRAKNALPDSYTPELDRETLELSDSYYKKAIVRARTRMVDMQREYVTKETDLNAKINKLYTSKLGHIEAQIRRKAG